MVFKDIDGVFENGEGIATLTGELLDGTPFEGTDSICIVPNLAKKSSSFRADNVPNEYELLQNHPNPFNPETDIRFQLPEASHVMVRIFNILGQEIRTLTDKRYEAGYHTVPWNGKDEKGNVVSSGIYLYMLQAGNFSQVMKMSLIR
ncbi:T9SS type A sorting domain-containing protein [candidate division KSB1 bacterium]|nr:T9SS type A sorting domain-containing protein [candidate division KSB1 bacterium]